MPPAKTWTVYDGQQVYADFQGSGALKTRYLSGPAVDELLARMDSGGSNSWYLTDRLGTVRDRVDASNGNVLNHIKYSSFGEVTYQSASNDTDRFKFTGREYDMPTKLSYHRARYLDTPSGRWTSEDPIGFAAGDFNLYRYVGNSATNYTDPSGLVGDRWWCDPLGWIGWADSGEDERGERLEAEAEANRKLVYESGRKISDQYAVTYAQRYGNTDQKIDAALSLGPLRAGHRLALTEEAKIAALQVQEMINLLGEALQIVAGLAIPGVEEFVVALALERGFKVLRAADGTLRLVNKAGKALDKSEIDKFADDAVRALEHRKGVTPGTYAHYKQGITDSLTILQKTCFVAGTPLLTPEGSKAIEQFRTGDRVLCRPEDQPYAPARVGVVEAIFELSAPILELRVGGRTLETTAEHPFYVAGEGWVRAERLRTGDRLLGHDEKLTAVESLSLTERRETVYNLRVADDHTYFVGSDAWGFSVWVHNAYTVRQAADKTWEVLDDVGAVVRSGLSGDEANRFARGFNSLRELSVDAQTARRHLRGSVPGTGGQAHHIIPFESRDHEIVRRAARGGFDINGANNGIRLDLTQHLGSHPRYNAAVRRKLDELLRTNPGISDIEAARALQQYADQLRAGLERSPSMLH